MTAQRLAQLSVEVARVVQRARNTHADLWGSSMLDLVADHFPHEPLENLRAALAKAGLTKPAVTP